MQYWVVTVCKLLWPICFCTICKLFLNVQCTYCFQAIYSPFSTFCNMYFILSFTYVMLYFWKAHSLPFQKKWILLFFHKIFVFQYLLNVQPPFQSFPVEKILEKCILSSVAKNCWYDNSISWGELLYQSCSFHLIPNVWWKPKNTCSSASFTWRYKAYNGPFSCHVTLQVNSECKGKRHLHPTTLPFNHTYFFLNFTVCAMQNWVVTVIHSFTPSSWAPYANEGKTHDSSFTDCVVLFFCYLNILKHS